jgi:hypothetical protein
VTCTCRRERRLQSEHSCRLHQMHCNKRFWSPVMSAHSCFQRLPALLLSSQRSSRLTNLFGMHPGQDVPPASWLVSVKHLYINGNKPVSVVKILRPPPVACDCTLRHLWGGGSAAEVTEQGMHVIKSGMHPGVLCMKGRIDLCFKLISQLVYALILP